VAHLNDEDERRVAITYLLEEFASWTFNQQGTADLKSLLVIDECAGLLPPHPKTPSTKPPLMTLAKQARAFGCGLVLATQNPKDVDYKALSNCQTWLVGKLQTKLDRDRVMEGMNTMIDKSSLGDMIKGLAKREFIYAQDNQVHKVTSPNVLTTLKGPLTISDLMELHTKGQYYPMPNIDKVQDAMDQYMAKYAVTQDPAHLRAYIDLESKKCRQI
jgi:hypothetical protein